MPYLERFSLAGGNPKVPDVAKSAQGMALEFSLPHGEFSMMEWLHVVGNRGLSPIVLNLI